MKSDAITELFKQFANELHTSFPQLDLRFNLKGGTSTLRYFMPDTSEQVFEANLNEQSLEELLHQAIFNVKELARLFDA